MTANGRTVVKCVQCSSGIKVAVPEDVPAMFSLTCPYCAKLWLYMPRDIETLTADDAE
jgi:DNA-directed RNA polymerase subunit RPC12/RpoP